MLKYGYMSAKRVLAEVRSDENGLSDEEAARRLSSDGPNSIEKKSKNPAVKVFFSQFKDVMTILLIAAAAISAIIAFVSGDSGGLTDTFIILAIIMLNAVVGAVQQYRADKAIEGLKKLSATYAHVRRGGEIIKTESSKIVIGDVICLEEGDLVPADCRILSANGLKCDESALTGESTGVEKREGVIVQPSAPVSAMYNMLFGSTFVLSGNATAVVTGTGRNTQIGEIADMLEGESKDKTPLEKSLDKLGKVISVFVLAVAAAVFLIGVFLRGTPLIKGFMTAVAVAVAAIPEGLPAVVTVIMAMGVQRMSKKNVIIRKLKCVETLGGCSCICTDKTGTLTRNRMKVTEIFTDFKSRSTEDIAGVNPLLYQAIAVCTHVKGEKGAYSGDPTEVALKNLQAQAEYECDFVPLGEIPFTSERKMMSVAATVKGKSILFVKGAPDVLIKKCEYVNVNGYVRKTTERDIRRIIEENDRMSDGALRVIAFACRDGADTVEENLTFIGLCGMIDGLKKGVVQAVSDCKAAGITTVMITGDHARTAFAIAKKAGIAESFDQVVSGEQLDKMNKSERVAAIKRCKVFARVSPSHKNLIVKVKKSAGEVVAMTGDGVNDAPPVKSADIGVAMGKSGTDVTKSVADMVIADDNFVTIVSAVKEGRRISSNVKKTLQFFLSTNLAEVFAILFATIAFFKSDFLLSTQLLWINLITDSFPVLALGAEKGDPDAMSRPPERAEKAVFNAYSVTYIVVSAVYMSGVTVALFAFALAAYGNAAATTMTFLCVSFTELFHAFNVRTERRSAFGKGALSNKILLVTVIVGIAVNVGLCFSPLASAFGLCRLGALQWLYVFISSLSVVAFGEAYKFAASRISAARKRRVRK